MGAVHASSHSEVAPIVAGLISQGLETATHITDSEEVQEQARDLPGDTYQATTAMTVKIGETNAVWIAADRAGFCPEAAVSPLALAPACSSPWAISTTPTTSQPAPTSQCNRFSPARPSLKSCPCKGHPI